MSTSVSPASHAVKGVLIDPPLGVVTIDLREDRVDMRFSNAHVESFPPSAVGYIGGEDRSVALNWGGTPIVFQCADRDDADHFSDRFDVGIGETDDHSIRAFRLGYGGQLAS